MLYRESGVGKEIVRQLVERSSGVQLYLISPSNRCRFYEKAGFKALAPWEVPRYVYQCVQNAPFTQYRNAATCAAMCTLDA